MTQHETGTVCACGRNHTLPIREIVIANQALSHLSGCRERLGLGKKVMLIADANSLELVGLEAERLLREDGCEVKRCLFETRDKIIPNEMALTKVFSEFDPETDFMVAAGSGTINDITRFISSKVGKPYISLPTAPSMDGYTSVVAPLIINGFKKPWPATYPLALYAEVQVLRQAPKAMIAAGFGDLLGKVTSRADWVLTKVINNEYYCQTTVDLVQNALDECIANVDGFTKGDEKAIGALMKGLIDAGIGMLWTGNSRPASGSEHLIAQFWEMKSVARGEFKHLHGDEVGVGTVLCTAIYREMLGMDLAKLDLERVVSQLRTQAQWEADARQVYGSMAGEVFKENAHKTFDRAVMRQHIERIIATAEQWQTAIRPFMLTPERTIELLQKVGAPYLPAHLDLDRARTIEGMLHSQASRNRYTILEAAEYLGCLEPIAVKIAAEF